MNSNRYNTFYKIHKGLRAMLYETALQMQRTDMGNMDAGIPVIRSVEEILIMFDTHASGEDAQYNSPLEDRDRSVAVLFEKEHEEDHRLARQLGQLVTAWQSANSGASRNEIGARLFYAFNEFIAFNLYHMNKEESLLNEVMWKHYTDEEILQKEKAIVRSLTPDKLKLAWKVMARGLNNHDLSEWLSEVRNSAPSAVFDQLSSIVRSEVPEQRMKEIEAVLLSPAPIM
ncbi:MAG: hemerythrin domain-containing protein [Bacteroidetes bacterium]|nr:hemerythrin domain-containing protein [Bacteroidota bacterium]